MPATFEDIVKQELAVIRQELGDLSEDIHGMPKRGVKGIRERLDTVETLATAMSKEREAINNRLKGLLIGLGLTGLASAGTLAAVARLITGGP